MKESKPSEYMYSGCHGYLVIGSGLTVRAPVTPFGTGGRSCIEGRLGFKKSTHFFKIKGHSTYRCSTKKSMYYSTVPGVRTRYLRGSAIENNYL